MDTPDMGGTTEGKLQNVPQFSSVGVIGSKKKTAAGNQKLRERGVSEEAISRVHTPIGTSIKAVTPEEIGISIAGELIDIRAPAGRPPALLQPAAPCINQQSQNGGDSWQQNTAAIWEKSS